MSTPDLNTADIDWLIEFLQSNRWSYDDNPPTNTCNDCGASRRTYEFRSLSEIEHESDCKIDTVIGKLQMALPREPLEPTFVGVTKSGVPVARLGGTKTNTESIQIRPHGEPGKIRIASPVTEPIEIIRITTPNEYLAYFGHEPAPEMFAPAKVYEVPKMAAGPWQLAEFGLPNDGEEVLGYDAGVGHARLVARMPIGHGEYGWMDVWSGQEADVNYWARINVPEPTK